MPRRHARRFCYFHNQHRQQQAEINSHKRQQSEEMTLPLLEDANAIQMELARIMLLLLKKEIDPRIAGQLLYSLQTAAANLKRTNFEPEPTRVVVKPKSVAKRPLGVSAWSTVEGVEYDDLSECINQAQPDAAPQKLGEATLDHMLNSVISKAVMYTSHEKRKSMSKRL
jgi:hypothetical protein